MNDAVKFDVLNPYPGLRPFRVEEKHLFFGREEQVDRMLEKLEARRFLAVVGGSGSGKSSLVNCGLRPALHRGNMASAGSSWRMIQIRPGSDPFGAFAKALAEPDLLFSGHTSSVVSLQELVATTLRLGSLGLVDLIDQADLHPDTKVLVIVDQFEELFRFRSLVFGERTDHFSPGEDAVAFVHLLLEAVMQTAVPIYIVITMRSDFLGECAQFCGLPEAINDGQYLVPRLNRS
ncbi:MAG: putative rane protein, partial [Cellvibrio sp.]|nr:putative rane protein [Cellvibrio sp.]